MREQRLPETAPQHDVDPVFVREPYVSRVLGICTAGWPFVAVALAVQIGLWIGFGMWGLLFAPIAFWVPWFFRDPEREIPADPSAIVSPADGTVLDIRETLYPRLLEGSATRVSIFMSVFNVHVNRIPFTGVVRQVEYNRGKFLAAFAEKASLENEQSATLLDTGRGVPILFIQIAGLIARRIHNGLGPGHRVERGQRYGLIRFGSRMDVYLPRNIRVTVRKGEKVKGGKTILGVFP